MKKWLVTTFFILNAAILFAQKNISATPVLDTVKAKWGKIKIVDGTAMTSANDFIENMGQSQEYSFLVKAIDNAGLTQTFKSKGPITVFAPTNKAFNKLPQAQLDSLLLPSHKYELSYLLTTHAIAGRITAKDIAHKINSSKGIATFTTIAGSKLTAKIDSNRNIVLVDDNGGECIISKFDVPQSNGLLHVANSVLVPKAKTI